MTSQSLIMYEQLTLDEDVPMAYADIYQCYECRRFIEDPPIQDDAGNNFCSVDCRDDYNSAEAESPDYFWAGESNQ